jgi:hypothetical protein
MDDIEEIEKILAEFGFEDAEVEAVEFDEDWD